MSEKLKNYYSSQSISQSQLKTLVYGPEVLREQLTSAEEISEEKTSLIIGKAVDSLITGLEEDEFNEEFYVSNLENKPSSVIKNIIDEVYSLLPKDEELLSLENYSNLILDSCNNFTYYSNWKDETRVNKIIEAGYEYFNDLKKANNRIILSQEEYQKILEIVNSIKRSIYTKKYFEESFLNEVIYQLPIYFKLGILNDTDNINCKALLDMVIINHEERTIQIIDIKTMGDKTYNFHKNFIRHKYYIQAAMYMVAMDYYIKFINTNLQDYKILPFKFLVESTVEVGYPRVFIVSPELLNIGLYGRPELYSDTESILGEKHKVRVKQKVIGLYKLIELYAYYMNTHFEKEKEYLENKGHFMMTYEGLIH